MRLSSRWSPGGVLGALAVSSTLLIGGMPTMALARASTVYKVGVDNSGPNGHNFEYVDYFPRDHLRVHPGDVLDFNWNPGSLDGAHTVSFLPKGAAAPGFVVPEPAGDEASLEISPQVLFPTDQTCGATEANPCAFDGSKAVSSGFIADDPSRQTPPYFADFFVTLDAKLLNGQSSAELTYICEIHPGMSGSVTLVSNSQKASELDDVREAAADQLERDTRGALRAERSADRSVTRDRDDNPATAVAGTATQFVEVAEMLPRIVTVKPGSTINWVTRTIKDPHTVTFPQGPGSDSVDPLPPMCEAPGNDTPASTVGPPCANLANFEVHLVPQPLGTTIISTPTTIGSSGVIGSAAAGFPNQFSFSFPNAGVFAYQCRIHDHMTGTVIVSR